MKGDTNKVKVRDLSGDAELFHLTNAAGEEYSTIEVGGFEWLSCPREDAPIPSNEPLLPCVCGCKRREHWVTYVKGTRMQVLKCIKCGRSESGTTIREVRHNWNEMVRGEQESEIHSDI